MEFSDDVFLGRSGMQTSLPETWRSAVKNLLAAWESIFVLTKPGLLLSVASQQEVRACVYVRMSWK